MVDWNAVKTEYITTHTSYSKLAQKYGIHINTIALRSKQEKWVEQRKKYCEKTVTNTVEEIGKEQVKRSVKLVKATEQLLDKIISLLEDETEVLSAQWIKNISSALKDVKEIQMIKSDMDIREQEARIANLRKQAEKDNDVPDTIAVVFAAGSEEWNE